MSWVLPALSILLLLLACGLLLRHRDQRADRSAWDQLLQRVPRTADTFSAALIEDLPDPAQRYFRYTIEDGARLHPAVRITMGGELSLGDARQPNYRPMQARQLLAPPYGLVWILKTGPISGSDAITPTESWTRFRVFGLLPVVRTGGTADHRRSAFGRLVAEAAFWSPASLLPSPLVRWEAVDAHTARATVRFGDLVQTVDITINQEGRPTRVLIPRWSNENPDRVFQLQPFGGEMAEFRSFDGYRLPTRVTGGNHFGTVAYFPFYRAEVTDIQFAALDLNP